MDVPDYRDNPPNSPPWYHASAGGLWYCDSTSIICGMQRRARSASYGYKYENIIDRFANDKNRKLNFILKFYLLNIPIYNIYSIT